MSEKRFKLSDWCGEQNVSNVIDIEKQTHLINVEVVDLLNEQQATIRKLQDLCGESDGENMKLRIENKRLQGELNDCEKFRYTVFKRLNDEIKLLKPTNIEQYEQIQKLQKENEQLQAKLREKEQDEQLYANEIVELRKTNEEWLQFKELGGDY